MGASKCWRLVNRSPALRLLFIKLSRGCRAAVTSSFIYHFFCRAKLSPAAVALRRGGRRPGIFRTVAWTDVCVLGWTWTSDGIFGALPSAVARILRALQRGISRTLRAAAPSPLRAPCWQRAAIKAAITYHRALTFARGSAHSRSSKYANSVMRKMLSENGIKASAKLAMAALFSQRKKWRNCGDGVVTWWRRK